MSEDTIIIKAPRGTKAAWVRASNRLGMKLSDFVVEGMTVISKVFDVTLYWHDGGSIFLGSVYAESREKAEEIALQSYMKKNIKQAKEIEEGGSFQVSAELMSPGQAANWLERWMTRDR